MTPSNTLYNISYGTFADAEALCQLRDRSLSICVERSDLSNLIGGKFSSTVALTLRRSFTQPCLVRVGRVLSVRAIFEIVRRIVQFISVLMVNLYIVCFYSKWRGWFSKKRKRNQDMNRLEMRLAIFAHSDYVVSSFTEIGSAYHTWLSSPCWIDALDRSYSSKRGYFIDSFKALYCFPCLHVILHKLILFSIYYIIFLNTYDWNVINILDQRASLVGKEVHP